MNQYGKESIPFFFMIDFEMQKPVVLPLDIVEPEEILFDFRGFRNFTSLKDKPLIHPISKQAVDFNTYKKAFDIIQQEIHYGNTFLVNLTFPNRIGMNNSLREIFHFSRAKYKLMYKDQFVVFSPEIFLQIENGQIFSNPMKGTIDASIPDARQKILENRKERAEHNTIVDLIRNDLSIPAKKVRVNKFRYLDLIKTTEKDLFQVSSQICGQLEENYPSRIGDILAVLLPAGSISGAPKKKTLEIIQQAEMDKRGYYTGICGYFQNRMLDSFVMIRYIENKQGEYYFRSGGGITVNSYAEDEYQELIDKINVPFA